MTLTSPSPRPSPPPSHRRAIALLVLLSVAPLSGACTPRSSGDAAGGSRGSSKECNLYVAPYASCLKRSDPSAADLAEERAAAMRASFLVDRGDEAAAAAPTAGTESLARAHTGFP
jgi:hypothetical protein